MTKDKKPIDPINKVVGKRLRYKREQAGISQTALGDKVSVSRVKIGQYEAGTSAIPAATLYKFARIFEVSVTYFYDDIAQPGDASAQGFDPLSNKEAITMLKCYEEVEDEKVRGELANLIKETASFFNKKKS